MRCLIIGGDAAGMSAASQIRRAHKDWEIVVLEKGPFTSYGACGIPYLVAGEVAQVEDLVVVTPEEFRRKRNIDVRTGSEAVRIDTNEQVVHVRADTSEDRISYDKLLIATGAAPIVPPWEGLDLEGVTTLRTLVDAQALLSQLEVRQPRRAVIIGGGYVGLEMAEAFSTRGLDVTMVERLDRVMGGAEPKITELVRAVFEDKGIELQLSTTVEGLDGEGGRVCGVRTDRGTIPADIALIALGVRPRSELARDAGIELGARGAIHVDAQQKTSIDNVWAAGDCAVSLHRVLEKPVFVPLALGANRQGRVAGTNMAGGSATFPGIVGTAVTRVFDLAIGRTGIDEQTAAENGIPVASVEATAKSRAHYMPGASDVWVKIIYRTDNLRVIGGWMCGHDTCLGKRNDILATAVAAKMTLPDVADLDLSYSPPFAPVWDPVLHAATKGVLQLNRG